MKYSLNEVKKLQKIAGILKENANDGEKSVNSAAGVEEILSHANELTLRDNSDYDLSDWHDSKDEAVDEESMKMYEFPDGFLEKLGFDSNDCEDYHGIDVAEDLSGENIIYWLKTIDNEPADSYGDPNGSFASSSDDQED